MSSHLYCVCIASIGSFDAVKQHSSALSCTQMHCYPSHTSLMQYVGGVCLKCNFRTHDSIRIRESSSWSPSNHEGFRFVVCQILDDQRQWFGGNETQFTRHGIRCLNTIQSIDRDVADHFTWTIAIKPNAEAVEEDPSKTFNMFVMIKWIRFQEDCFFKKEKYQTHSSVEKDTNKNNYNSIKSISTE